MDLTQYVLNHGQGAQKHLAIAVGVTKGFIWQLVHNKRPVPLELCAPIEQATNGEVTRKDLRPDDWAQIWPELVGK